MIDTTELAGVVFSGLSALVIEDVEDAGEVIVVRVRTRGGAVSCPGCGAETGRVHGYHERTAADVPADGRRVVLKVRARRMRCPVTGCGVQTFREQVPGVLGRYQRRTARLAGQVSSVARELAGRASARLLPALGIAVSALNTVKRYDRASEPQRLQRVPKYRPTLVDPYRDHLRKRRAEEPGIPVRQLLREIRELGLPGQFQPACPLHQPGPR